MTTVTGNGAAGAGPTSYRVAVIDAPTVTWDPPVPRRRPRPWPAIAGLAITAVVIAGGFYLVISGVRVRYTERADKCAALELTPVTRLFGRQPLPGYPDVAGSDCLAAVGDTADAPRAIVRLSVNYFHSTAEARLTYETDSDPDSVNADSPGRVGLPGANLGRLTAAPLEQRKGCVIRAALQDVNLTMNAQLTFDGPAAPCDPHGAAAQALAATMRQTLEKLD
jgi:hypothetical protein